jgi:hypothetical protein
MATTAVLDRLFHKAHIFNIDGHSHRPKNFSQTMKGVYQELPVPISPTTSHNYTPIYLVNL